MQDLQFSEGSASRSWACRAAFRGFLWARPPEALPRLQTRAENPSRCKLFSLACCPLARSRPWRTSSGPCEPAGPARKRAWGTERARRLGQARPTSPHPGLAGPPSTRPLLRLVGQGRQGIARDDVDERMQQVVGPAIGSPEGARSQLLVKHRLLTTDVPKADLAVLGCRELD